MVLVTSDKGITVVARNTQHSQHYLCLSLNRGCLSSLSSIMQSVKNDNFSDLYSLVMFYMLMYVPQLFRGDIN